MIGLLWYLFELVLLKNILQMFGLNWLLIFGLALLAVFLELLVVALPSDDYRINYRP